MCVDGNGKIIHVDASVNTSSHASDVLAAGLADSSIINNHKVTQQTLLLILWLCGSYLICLAEVVTGLTSLA